MPTTRKRKAAEADPTADQEPVVEPVEASDKAEAAGGEEEGGVGGGEAVADGAAGKAQDGSSAPSAVPTAGGAEPAWRKKDVLRAQWWYYIDQEDKKQGPFYPGVMQEWFKQQYFVPDATKVAPSFNGEIPKKDHFVVLSEVFSAPIAETAFKVTEGIALFPPQQLPITVYDEDDEPVEGRNAQWLEEKLREKRAERR